VTVTPQQPVAGHHLAVEVGQTSFGLKLAGEGGRSGGNLRRRFVVENRAVEVVASTAHVGEQLHSGSSGAG
jgi:hypothetical protein